MVNDKFSQWTNCRFFLITVSFMTIANCANTQSVVLGLMHEQSRLVYKGVVEKIEIGRINGEGTSFYINTKVEEVYKGLAHRKKIKIGTFKPHIIDTILKTSNEFNFNFHVEKGGTYIFFVKDLKKSKGGTDEYLAELSEHSVEGVLFDTALETKVKSLGKRMDMLVESRNYVAFKLLNQGSTNIVFGKVDKIKKLNKRGIYKLSVKSKDGEIYVYARGLNCVCKSEKIKVGTDYIFFLTNTKKKNNFMLTDRWIGVMEQHEDIVRRTDYINNKSPRH